MTPTTITNTEVCRDSTTVEITEVEANATTTKSCIDNQTTTITETDTKDDCQKHQCLCGHLDLRKLAEETRHCAFKSSNISAATANSVMIFAMKILQEILISECKSEKADVTKIILIASAIGQIGNVILIYNPQSFNS